MLQYSVSTYSHSERNRVVPHPSSDIAVQIMERIRYKIAPILFAKEEDL